MRRVWQWHWAVDDGSFTDRWDFEDADGRYGWVDRMVDGGDVRYECLLPDGTRETLTDMRGAFELVRGSLGG